jgi:thymidylate kinase
MDSGKLIVICGAPNLGKTVQATKLADRIGGLYIKYPIYDLEPTGPKINAVLRQGLPMTDIELQRTFAQNRRDFEPYLLQILGSGRHVVAEDYVGTGIAWGMTKGIEYGELLNMNLGLREPDVTVMLEGERFVSGIERGHRFESGGDWEKAQEIHKELAKINGWRRVWANDSIEVVHENIFNIVSESL